MRPTWDEVSAWSKGPLKGDDTHCWASQRGWRLQCSTLELLSPFSYKCTLVKSFPLWLKNLISEMGIVPPAPKGVVRFGVSIVKHLEVCLAYRDLGHEGFNCGITSGIGVL